VCFLVGGWGGGVRVSSGGSSDGCNAAAVCVSWSCVSCLARLPPTVAAMCAT
jgi:hypothetical protein